MRTRSTSRLLTSLESSWRTRTDPGNRCGPVMRGAGIADDLTIYAALQTAVLAELRQRLGEDAKLRYNMGKLKIYIPGVSRDRARELVLEYINQDPSLESLRELYDKDTAEARARAPTRNTVARAATAAEIRNQAIHNRVKTATAGISDVIATMDAYTVWWAGAWIEWRKGRAVVAPAL